MGCISVESQIRRHPEFEAKVRAFLWDWGYACAKWERYAIAWTRGEKVSASKKLTKFERGY